MKERAFPWWLWQQVLQMEKPLHAHVQEGHWSYTTRSGIGIVPPRGSDNEIMRQRASFARQK